MRRRNFQALVVLWLASAVGCKTNKEHISGFSNTKFKKFEFPYSFWLWDTLLPNTDFIGFSGFEINLNEYSKSISILGELLSTPIIMEDRIKVKELIKIITSLKPQISAATLHESDLNSLEKISAIIHTKSHENCNLRYSSRGDIFKQKIYSLDLLGVRNPASYSLFSRGLIDPSIAKNDNLDIRVFDLISDLFLDSIFFNYAKCEFTVFSTWLSNNLSKIANLECIGLPSGLNIEECHLILDTVVPEILDLSGYEDDSKLLAEIIQIAQDAGVRIIVISDYYGFDWNNLLYQLNLYKQSISSDILIVGYNSIVADV